jgi:hypothetical protein
MVKKTRERNTGETSLVCAVTPVALHGHSGHGAAVSIADLLPTGSSWQQWRHCSNCHLLPTTFKFTFRRRVSTPSHGFR